MKGPDDPARSSDLDSFWRALVACHNNLPSLLRVVAQQVVDVIGDGCVLTTVTSDRAALHPSAVLHADPKVARSMRAVLANDEMRIGEGLAGTVASDVRPIMLNDIDPQTIVEATPARFRPFAIEHPIRALLIVPMVAGAELVGTLGAVRTSSDGPYTVRDLRLLEALAERAALAIAEAVAAPRGIGAADYEAIYLHSLDGVLLTTPDGHILAANPAACTMLRMTEREILQGGRERVVVTEDPRLARALAARAAAGHARTELTLRRGDDTLFEADVASTIFTTPDGRARTCMIIRDVSREVAAREEMRARMAQLEEVADRDDLTGLWNRRGFAVAAHQALARCDREGNTSQLLFVDVDGMKQLNDTYGHGAGDAAIIAVADAIRGATREMDVIARMGGDEFLVLLANTERGDVPEILERIEEALAVTPEVPTPLSVSTGVVERPPHADVTLADLVDAADRDMYQHKVLHRLRRGDDESPSPEAAST